MTMGLRWTRILVVSVGCLVLAANTPPDDVRIARARALYDALVAGRVSVAELSPRDREELVAVDEMLRRRAAIPSDERCVADEIARAGKVPTRLERRIIEMKCREPGEGLAAE